MRGKFPPRLHAAHLRSVDKSPGFIPCDPPQSAVLIQSGRTQQAGPDCMSLLTKSELPGV